VLVGFAEAGQSAGGDEEKHQKKAHTQPPNPKVSVPMTSAPIAPDRLSDPRQNAIPAMIRLTTEPRSRGIAIK
jgi:hypothetical protein